MIDSIGPWNGPVGCKLMPESWMVEFDMGCSRWVYFILNEIQSLLFGAS